MAEDQRIDLINILHAYPSGEVNIVNKLLSVSDQAVVNAIMQLLAQLRGEATGGPSPVRISGGFDMRGLAADKPAAGAVAPGTTYWSVDTDPHGETVEISDGENWVVI